MKNQKGFTLVELAIVMIIIGLLLGGVLKGAEMIENARVTSTITQLKGYQSALVSFQDIYAAVPGDMNNATTRVPGCVAPCENGNGNSIVGTSGAANGDVTIQAGASASAGAEGLLFWKHLALADLISGVDTTAALAATIIPGSTNPKSPYGGALNIFSSEGATYQPGLVIMISNVTTGAYAGTAGQRVLPALRLSQIDTKLDDGRGNTGSVEGTPLGAAAGDCSTAAGVYANSKVKDCNLSFALGY
jgi:prepilin-type N-terminal cleavage/methylation domain-containing protein